jgi:DNA-binding response OmpR family regulator
MTSDSIPSILCADDDPEALELLKEHLTLQGFIVLTATNGVEACLQVKRWAPKAVILDLLIPRLGGLGTLSRIRAFNPSIPIIFVSDTTDTVDLLSEAGLPAAGAFAKPLDMRKISDALARAGVTAPGALAEAGDQRCHARPRVLLVDDEPQFREMLAEHLSGKGIEVLGAESGEEALVQAQASRPHVVLLDLMMGGMGGLEAVGAIKAVCPETRIIIVTGVDDLDTARHALTAGATDYVTKPFTFRYLDAVLDIHLPVDELDAPLATKPPLRARPLERRVMTVPAGIAEAEHVIAIP